MVRRPASVKRALGPNGRRVAATPCCADTSSPTSRRARSTGSSPSSSGPTCVSSSRRSKTVVNSPQVPPRVFASRFAADGSANPVAMVDRPPAARQGARRIQFLQPSRWRRCCGRCPTMSWARWRAASGLTATRRRRLGSVLEHVSRRRPVLRVAPGVCGSVSRFLGARAGDAWQVGPSFGAPAAPSRSGATVRR